jgi:kynurenine formamidase
MKIRSFIIAYALVLAILLFADRRPNSAQQDRYSHVVDLTDGTGTMRGSATAPPAMASNTRIIAPDTLIPGTWTAGQIPAERLIAPLVVIDEANADRQVSLDDIAAWEVQHGMIPQGSIVAVRRNVTSSDRSLVALGTTSFPVESNAAQFLMDARYAIGFAVETPVDLTSDRTLARQIALHGSYVVEGAARFASLPAKGSLVIVAPAKNKNAGAAPVRVLAMVR